MDPIGTTARLFQIGKIVATSPKVRITHHFCWPFGRWPLASLRGAKMIGNSIFTDRGCGNDFADLKKPGCRANRIHLWAEFRSQENSSNMAQRFWPMYMESGRVLHKFGRKRARDRAEFAGFLEPDWCREFLKVLKGPGAAPQP